MASITVLLDPAEMPNRTQDQETFDNNNANLYQKLPVLGAQINAATANMNSIAAGGAYAIPLVYANAGSNITGGGVFLFGSAGFTQSTATELHVGETNAGGQSITFLLASLVAGATSSTKGTIRLVKQGDLTKFATYYVTGYVQATNNNFFNVSVVPGGISDPNPFQPGDAILLYFQRTGDVGAQGPAGTNGSMQLLASATVSTAVANIDFLNTFTSAYDTYAVEIQGMTVSATTGLNIWMAKAGAVDTSAVYYTPVGDGAAATASQTVFAFSGVTVPSGASGALTATLRFRNTNSATATKGLSLQGFASGSVTIKESAYIGANTVTGFRLSSSTAQNFTAGTIRVYGIKNS